MLKQYDVVIIGAGVVGSAIARELSRYQLHIAVLEKNLDVCNETSGRNSAVVHGGFANPTGSLKAKCCVEGNRIMDQLAAELDFPFKRCGKVLVGNTSEDRAQLERTMAQGAVNGCTGLEMIDDAKLHEMVPAVVGKFAMWSKNSGIMDPFLYTVALAENAHANGVEFYFDHEVIGITRASVDANVSSTLRMTTHTATSGTPASSTATHIATSGTPASSTATHTATSGTPASSTATHTATSATSASSTATHIGASATSASSTATHISASVADSSSDVAHAAEASDTLYYIHTSHGDFCTRWVVNAAGLGAKAISDMLGLTGYRVIGSRSNYIILHKRMGKLLPMPVYPVPSNTYMGIHITPTVDGNVTIGPDAENTDVLDDYGVPQANMDSLAVEGAKLWPYIFKKDQIRTFAGIQPKWVDANGAIQDWKVEIRDEIAPQAVNLVGIESPGLTGSVPLARYVIDMMQKREAFTPNPGFNPNHKGIVRFASCTKEEQEALIEEDPDYGEMICSCEEVTRSEILQAIHNPLGVHTMTGIKYRTRAMMGGCQGGFCQMKIEQFIEQELGMKPEDVRYNRQNAWLLTGEMRKEN